jgi:hypothetical protein
MWFFSSGKIFAESIYHTLVYRHLPILFSLFESIYIFFKDLPDTLKKRKEIQKNRVVKDIEILKLKTPQY